jgi:hypothetical protein
MDEVRRPTCALWSQEASYYSEDIIFPSRNTILFDRKTEKHENNWVQSQSVRRNSEKLGIPSLRTTDLHVHNRTTTPPPTPPPTFLHTYIHTYIHAYIHTYIHTHIPRCQYTPCVQRWCTDLHLQSQNFKWRTIHTIHSWRNLLIRSRQTKRCQLAALVIKRYFYYI